MPEEIRVNDPKEIWNEAIAFETTSRVIHNAAYDQMEKGKEDLATSMTYAAFVNHAYSFELYLKCLMAIKHGHFYKGHKLLDIFKTLPQETKDEIIHNHNTRTIIKKSVTQAIPERGDFIKSLTEASNAFIDYRYLHNGKIPNEEYDLSFPMHSIKEMIIKERPDFLNQ